MAATPISCGHGWPKRAISIDQRNITFGRGDLAREVTDGQAAWMALVDRGGTARDPSPRGDRRAAGRRRPRRRSVETHGPVDRGPVRRDPTAEGRPLRAPALERRARGDQPGPARR